MTTVEEHVLVVLADGPARFNEIHRLVKPSFPQMKVQDLAVVLENMWASKAVDYDNRGWHMPSPSEGDPSG